MRSTSSDGSGFQGQLIESKIMRKKAEEDAQALANRIALLQMEEKKALKKVEETRKKAEDIMAHKNRNVMALKQKQEVKTNRVLKFNLNS